MILGELFAIILKAVSLDSILQLYKETEGIILYHFDT